MYKKYNHSWVKHLDFFILDLVCLQLVYIFAGMTHYGYKAFNNQSGYAGTIFLIIAVDICVVFFQESYRDILRRGSFEEWKASLIHVTSVTAFMLMYVFITAQNQLISWVICIEMWLYAVILISIIRILRKKQIMHVSENERNLRSVIFVVGTSNAERVLKNAAENQYRVFSIAGIVLADQNKIGETIQGIAVVACKDDMLEYIRKNIVDEIFVNLPPGVQLSDDVIELCIEMGITVHINLSGYNRAYMREAVETFGGYTVLTTSLNIADPVQLFLKRILDLIGGMIGIILTSFIFIFVAPCIYIKSPGPIFFSQTRIGKNGRQFKIYKFRSMYMDAEERKRELMAQNKMSDGLMFKIDDDPRIIKGIGHFIRKTSIDELPQLWNVLKGEMSLVGTRPPTVDEYEQYQYHHKSRLAAKPGITGMWQVSGRSDITNFEQVVALDTQYICEWSFGLDLKILLKTILVVLKRDGSV